MIRKTRKPVMAFITTVTTTILLAGCVVHVGAKDYNRDMSEDYTSLNKRVSVPSGVSVDEISSVNGKVEVADDVTADEISSVNGKIEIGKGSSVGRNVATVNGKIDLSEVTVGRDVETVNGNIELRDGTVVKGDIIMGSPDNNNNNNYWKKRPPVLSIDSSSTVEGNIIVYREVEFDFEDESLRAKVINRAEDY